MQPVAEMQYLKNKAMKNQAKKVTNNDEQEKWERFKEYLQINDGDKTIKIISASDMIKSKLNEEYTSE